VRGRERYFESLCRWEIFLQGDRSAEGVPLAIRLGVMAASATVRI
jgi:hypothetical protein